MKKLLLNITLLSFMAILSGCNDTTSDSVSSVEDLPKNIRMEKNVPYTVEKGDEIEKLSSDSKLKLDSDLNSGKTTVTLLNGEAAIIKK